MTGSTARTEDLGDHRFLVTVTEGDDLAEIQVYVDPAMVEGVALVPADEERLVQAAIAFLLERQRADDLPTRIDLDEVAAVYDGFLDDIRRRIGPASTVTD